MSGGATTARGWRSPAGCAPRERAVEREGEPIDLIDMWADEPQTTVIDAVSSGAEPGTIHRVDAGQARLPAELFRGSTHALGVAEAVELARALGRPPLA